MDEIYRFNRKTFNPIKNSEHYRILQALRRRGHGRYVAYNYHYFHKGKTFESQALRALSLQPTDETKVYIDLACGDSPDVLIALDMGYDAYAIDLFPPSKNPLHKASDARLRARFIQADMVDGLPFSPNSVDYASSHAAIALIKPQERLSFYKEVARVMKPNGKFALIGYSLKNGYEFVPEDERRLAIEAGFTYTGSSVFTYKPARPHILDTLPLFKARHFRKGDRVRFSSYGRKHLWDRNKDTTGIVTGFGRDGRCIRVLVDGRKDTATYYAGFWEFVPAPNNLQSLATRFIERQE